MKEISTQPTWRGRRGGWIFISALTSCCWVKWEAFRAQDEGVSQLSGTRTAGSPCSPGLFEAGAPHQGLWLGLCACEHHPGHLQPSESHGQPQHMAWRHGGRDWQSLPSLPVPLLLPRAWNATAPPRQVSRSVISSRWSGAGSRGWKGIWEGREVSSAGQWRWVDVGSFKLNWGSWRHQRIAVLNSSKEATYSPWKTQSYRNASLDFTWI